MHAWVEEELAKAGDPKGLCLYALRTTDGTGAIKIGSTKNLRARLLALQGNHHCRLELLVAYVTPSAKAGERKAHQVFKRARLRGEWYKPHPEILKAITFMQNLAMNSKGIYVAYLGDTPVQFDVRWF